MRESVQNFAQTEIVKKQ